jgi:hypothetical protein
MSLLGFISVLLLLTLFFREKERLAQSRAKKIKESRELDLKSPYIVRKYTLFSHKSFLKFNFDSLEEARDAAFKSVRKDELGLLFSEVAEVWHKDNLIQVFVTNERYPIDKISGFSFNQYNGNIKPEGYSPIDPKSLDNYRSIEIKLTNGDVVRFSRPAYSIRTDSIYGEFGAEFSPWDGKKSSLFNVIPMRIIETILTSHLR